MNREQLVKALVARKLASSDKNKIICGCIVAARQKAVSIGGVTTGRS
jgi:hypothetical protein